MPYAIAFVGVDGAGKSTLIKKIAPKLDMPVSHHNHFMKRFYKHKKSSLWEDLNLLETILREKWWRYKLKRSSIIMDRCYICGLVYSNIQGIPGIAHKILRWATKPDIVCLLEPVEELVPDAYMFTREYKRILNIEGYQQFRRGFHLFGRVTFWKRPEVQLNKLLNCYIDIIGSP